jgi:YD repeat-containing protein
VFGPRGQTEYQYDDAGGGGCCGTHGTGPRYVIDPDLDVTEYLYDDLGRVEWVIDEATGTRTKYRYDGLGSLVAAAELRDAAGDLVRETGYTYDWNGRLQAVVPPPANPGDTAGTTGYGYLHPDFDWEYRSDAAVTSVVDAQERESNYTWGVSGINYRQVVSAVLPDSGTDAYQYDGLGRLTLQNRANGDRWGWSYDMAGRPTGVVYGLNWGW